MFASPRREHQKRFCLNSKKHCYRNFKCHHFSAQLIPAAFGREHLLSERWLLGSSSKGADGIWFGLLEVGPEKQKLFLERVLFLHKLAVGRVSNQTTSALRLSSHAWETEVELACLGSHCLESMANAKDSKGDALFSQDLLNACRGRYLEGFSVMISIELCGFPPVKMIIEADVKGQQNISVTVVSFSGCAPPGHAPHPKLRDFMNDLSAHLASADPSFEASATLMWSENSPEKKQADSVDTALGAADQKISDLEMERSGAAWQADTLKLAKDAAMCAKLLQAASSNEKTDRLAKITHIKEQNRIGAAVITKFSEKNCRHVALASGDAEGQLSQACCLKNGSRKPILLAGLGF
eukprot:s10_g18.t1